MKGALLTTTPTFTSNCEEVVSDAVCLWRSYQHVAPCSTSYEGIELTDSLPHGTMLYNIQANQSHLLANSNNTKYLPRDSFGEWVTRLSRCGKHFRCETLYPEDEQNNDVFSSANQA
eukprot:998940-Amphidinium_carterae.1